MTKIDWSEAASNATSNGGKRWQDAAEGIILGIDDLLEDSTLPVGVKLLVLSQLTSVLNNRDHMVALATGRPVGAIGGGNNGNGDDEAATLRERISDLEQQLEDETTAKEDLERRLDAAERDLDINVHGSTAHRLEEAESQNASLKADRRILEATANEFGIAVPADTNTPFARDTAQKVKEAAQQRVDDAVAAASTPFDRAKVEQDFADISTALQAVQTSRGSKTVQGKSELADKLRTLKSDLGFPPPSTP